MQLISWLNVTWEDDVTITTESIIGENNESYSNNLAYELRQGYAFWMKHRNIADCIHIIFKTYLT